MCCLVQTMHDLSYVEIQEQFSQLAGKFASIDSASTLFSIPIDNECSPLIATVSYDNSANQDQGRPQVLISGEIHGNERVVS